MSKRAKFVLVTWVGPTVSVMKKAKMSTDKALMKDVIQVKLISIFNGFDISPTFFHRTCPSSSSSKLLVNSATTTSKCKWTKPPELGTALASEICDIGK